VTVPLRVRWGPPTGCGTRTPEVPHFPWGPLGACLLPTVHNQLHNLLFTNSINYTIHKVNLEIWTTYKASQGSTSRYNMLTRTPSSFVFIYPVTIVMLDTAARLQSFITGSWKATGLNVPNHGFLFLPIQNSFVFTTFLRSATTTATFP